MVGPSDHGRVEHAGIGTHEFVARRRVRVPAAARRVAGAGVAQEAVAVHVSLEQAARLALRLLVAALVGGPGEAHHHVDGDDFGQGRAQREALDIAAEARRQRTGRVESRGHHVVRRGRYEHGFHRGAPSSPMRHRHLSPSRRVSQPCCARFRDRETF